MKRLLLSLALLFVLVPAAQAQNVVCSTADSCSTYVPLTGSFGTADLANSTTSLIPGFISVNVRAGKRYTFEAFLFVTESTAADGAKIDFNGGTATMTNFIVTCLLINAVGAPLTQVAATATTLATPLNIAATTDALVHQYTCSGAVEPATSGTFMPRHAQNAHTTGTLTLKRGSFLTIQDIP
jgi:hypothetical protein